MWRYRLILLLFLFGFLAVIARLFYWQVVRAEELSLWGKSQYGQTIKLSSIRGEIKTSDGYPIATNRTSYVVFANPKLIADSDKLKTATILSALLDTSIASVSAKLNKDLVWVSIKNNVDAKTKTNLENLKLSGIGFESHFTRLYPEASMSAHLLGFVGKDDAGDDKGNYGLEGFYDRQLRGKDGLALQITDAFGRPILAKMNDDSGHENGRTLYTTVDRAIQFVTDRKLKEGLEKYGAVGGMVIIMDPKTGNILAMSSFPAFDPSSFGEFDSNSYKNPIISSFYEPGSTFKTLVMSAGLDSGVVKPDTKCPVCDKPVKIGEYEIKTWNNQYYKDTTMSDVILHSDNTGMVYVGQQLGFEKMMSYFEKFGVGSLTGIDLQGEVASPLRTQKTWYEIDTATATFGQGISITPIMLLDGFSSIANEGKRMEPHVVSKIETADGEIIEIKPKVLNTPIKSETAKVMTEVLVRAAKEGESKWAAVKGYRVAGKTGTAQIPIAGHYDGTQTIASFMGFAPADDPKFAMLVIVDRPTTSIYGSETAAPIFYDIARDIFSYYGIPPSD